MTKNCPFCGSKTYVEHKGTTYDHSIWYEVMCENSECYLSDGADHSFENPNDAINKWNESIKI
jgi:hypothetical protein